MILKGHLSPKPTPLQMQSVQQTSPAAAQMIFKTNLIPEWSGEYLHFSELWYRSQHHGLLHETTTNWLLRGFSEISAQNDVPHLLDSASIELSRVEKFKEQEEQRLSRSFLLLTTKTGQRKRNPKVQLLDVATLQSLI